MIEAYKIGLSLTLTGGIEQAVLGLTKDFATLNAAVKNIQISVNELASGMRGLQRIGASAAAEWNNVAAAMSKAAAAAKSAGFGAANGNVMQTPMQGTGTTGPVGGGGGPAVRAATLEAAGIAVTGAASGGGNGGGRGPLALGYSPPGSFAGGPGTGTGRPLTPGYGGGGGRAGGGMPPIIPPMGGGGASGGVAYPSSHDFAIAGAAAGAASTGIFAAQHNAFMAGAEIEAMKVRMKMAGYTDPQIAASMAAAREQTGPNGVPGLTQIDALHTMLDIRTITGDPDAGVAAFPALARLGLVLSAAGKGDQTAELYSAIQAGELRGAIVDPKTHKVDTKNFTKFLDNMQAAAIATGFRYGPREVLQTLRSGGISAAALSDQALFADQVLPMLTLGAAGGGTALQGFGMQFGAGKMSEAAGNILNQMGLLKDPKTGEPINVEKYKTGIGQINLMPGIMVGREQAMSDPAQFIVERLIPGIDKYLIANGIKPNDQERMIAAQQVASRIPGGKYMADFIRLMPLIAREREQFAAAQGRDGYNIRVGQDPNLQVAAMDAAFHNMMAEFGGALMKDAMAGMQNVTASLQALGKWAAEHPQTATRITEVAAALSVLAGAVAVISGALFVAAPLWRVAKWIGGPGSAVSAAGSAGAAGLGARAVAALTGPVGLGVAAFSYLFKPSTTNGGEGEGGYSRESVELRENLKRMFAAPTPANLNHGSQQRGPIPVIVTNGRDLASGVSSAQTRALSLPQAGSTGFDPTMQPGYQRGGP
jgi:hypothetical protein